MFNMDHELKLIYRTNLFYIPSNFPNLNDVNPEIHISLTQSKKYEIKSNVRKDVFKSFIDHWVYQKTPIISSDNISEYKQLSQEFDIMTDLIQLYQKMSKTSSNLTLLNKNFNLNRKIQRKKYKFHKKIQKYKEINKILLLDNQINNEFRFYEINSELLQSCENCDVKSVYLLTRKTVKKDGFLYSINDENKTASLLRSIEAYGDILIPRTIEYESKEYEITSISENAFKENQMVDSIQFCEDTKVTKFEKYSFVNSSIQKISIPSTVNELNKAFIGCSKLNEIEIDKNNKNFTFFNNDFILGKTDSENENFDVLIFARRDIKKAIIPSFIKRISCFAFAHCFELNEVEFVNHSKLELIEKYAFFNSYLYSISIPSSVRQINEKAFDCCFCLENISIPSNSQLKIFEKFIFGRCEIECISIPSSVIELHSSFCDRSKKLKKIIVNNNSHFTFYNDTFLLGKSDSESDVFDIILFARKDIKTALIPSFITKIASYSFNQCKNLEKVEFENNSKLKIIDNFSFSFCNFEKISIPSTVTKIGKEAFANNDALKYIEILKDSNLQIIEKNAFDETKVESIFVPSKIIKLMDGWCEKMISLKKFFIPPEIKEYKIFDDKFLLKKSESKSNIFDVLVFAKKDIEIAFIPPFIKQIGPFAFHECKKLKKIVFPDDSKLQLIGNSAFSNSSIRSISIPSSVIQIDEYAFCFCENLSNVEIAFQSKLKIIGKFSFIHTSFEKIKIPSNVFKLEESAFSECKKLKKIDFIDNSKLKLIELYAFNDSSIQSLSVPPSVVCISNFAFISCFKLQIIEIMGDYPINLINEISFDFSAVEIIMIPYISNQ